jgi:hypothetical protein
MNENTRPPQPTKPSVIEQDRDRQLQTLIGLSERFGDSLTTAFAKTVAEGRTSYDADYRVNV